MKPSIGVTTDVPEIAVYGKFGTTMKMWDDASLTWDMVGLTWDEQTGELLPSPGLIVETVSINPKVSINRLEVSAVPEKIMIVVTN